MIKKGSKHKGFVRNGLKDVQVRSHILLFLLKICRKSIAFHSPCRRFFWVETELFSCIVFTQARIRKGETGLVIFAGDVTPIEVC